jgi:hypothetical protein
VRSVRGSGYTGGMAFVIAGPRSQVCIDGVDEPLLAELPRRYGLSTPRCDDLWERFYGDPQLGSPAEVAVLRAEIEALRAAHARRRGDELARERKVTTQDPAVRARILESLLAGDPVLRKYDEIVAVCDEAIAAGQGLVCSSD